MKQIIGFLLIILILNQRVLADSKTSTPVAPGIVYHHEIRDAGPWQLFVLEIDRTNPWLKFESVKALDSRQALEKTSLMAARKDKEQHRVIGAINADFFEATGMPVGAQIINGILLKRPINRSAFAVRTDGRPLIDIFSFQGSVSASDRSVISVNGVNEARGENALIIYNNFFGATTGTNQWGTEIITELVSGDPAVNDTMRLVVTAKDSTMTAGSGNNAIPANGLVLSGHGTAGGYLDQHVFTGDTIAVLLRMLPDEGALAQLVGGTPRIIRNGVKSVEYAQEGISSSFATDRHPRTAIGFSADSSMVYFFVVDGRQAGYSVGMSLYELADYMLEWGIYQGVNLDGGGSSTMVVRGSVMNSPSDPGGERAVSNAMMIVSSAPAGPLAYLKIDPGKIFLLADEQTVFSVRAFDQYYNPLDIDPDTVAWSCDPQIGQIDAEGLFVSASVPDSGYIYASSGSVKDSARVYVTTLSRIELAPDPVVLKIGEQQQITPAAFDAYQNTVNLDLEAYDWQVSGTVGSVSSTGLFSATASGAGFITATYQAVSGSTEVSVGVSAEIMLDDFSSTDKWSLSGLLVNLNACSLTTDAAIYHSQPTSGHLDYSLNTGGTSVLYLDCTIPVSGSPSAVSLMVYGDGKGHWLRAEFQDADGEKFLLNLTEATPGIDWENSWKELNIPIENAIAHWSNPSAQLNFPLVWKRIYLAETDDTKKNAGAIYLDDFKAYYISTSVPEKSVDLPRNFRLEQNFPNPFNPETTILYSIPRTGRVQLDIFDLNGQKVESLVDSNQGPGNHQVKWRINSLSSSVYFYRLRFDDMLIATRKMVVLK